MHHRPRTTRFVAARCSAAAALLAVTAVCADDRLQRVEQGIADVGPLGVSLRSLTQELAVPVDFEEVRRSKDHPDQLVRSHGALHAVFPRSWYVQTMGGSMPLIPPGTIFRIGSESLDAALHGDSRMLPRPPHGTRPGTAPLAIPQQQIYRQDLPDYPRVTTGRGPGGPESGGGALTEQAPRIVLDEAYRRDRFTDLRDRAIAAQAARGPSPSSSK